MKIHKIKACIAVAALLLSGFGVHAQQAADPVVIEVGNQQVRQSELMAEFNKNVGYRLSPEATFAERQQALIEYAELYATFLAKVQDAHERGFDTMARLQRELLHYRKDLAAPYLIDSTELRRLVREAYDRNHYSLWAKQILVNVNAMATPADTLLAYNKALDLYRRAAAGEDFDSVTVSHIRGGVHGLMTPYTPDMNDLGYFTVFEMVYPFETAAYGLKVGEVSKPVRSQYGYHIIKLLDRVEGLFGQVSLAHIWLRDKDHNNAQQDINNIYKQLEEGGEFAHDYGHILANGGLLDILYIGVKAGVYPCLIFIGVGAMTDFGPLIANPKTFLLGAAAQFGVFFAFLGATLLGFTGPEAASIGIIGGADGPTAILTTTLLAPHLLGAR